jgi:hypothetical protein
MRFHPGKKEDGFTLQLFAFFREYQYVHRVALVAHAQVALAKIGGRFGLGKRGKSIAQAYEQKKYSGRLTAWWPKSQLAPS